MASHQAQEPQKATQQTKQQHVQVVPEVEQESLDYIAHGPVQSKGAGLDLGDLPGGDGPSLQSAHPQQYLSIQLKSFQTYQPQDRLAQQIKGARREDTSESQLAVQLKRVELPSPQGQLTTQLKGNTGAYPSPAEGHGDAQNGLPQPLKSGIENLSGLAMDDVQVHRNSDQPAQLGAYAYAQGTDIHLGPGQEKHLPHEAWHVVQQKQGRVQATRQLKNTAINDEDHLEKEADEMGSKAAQMKEQAPAPKRDFQKVPIQSDTVQRFEAPLHESATRNALVGKGGFSQEEASMIYYGNWMRDVNQGFVPSAIKLLGADTLYALLGYVSWQKFGKIPTSEQLGYYIPSEHIDSPVGAISGAAYLDSPPDISDSLENVGAVNPEKADPMDTKYTTKQEPTSPGSKAIPSGTMGIFDVDPSGVMGYIRRTNVHVEKRLTMAAERGRNEDGFLHLGAAMHAIEDLFAHSNFIEIATEHLLNTELRGLFSDLRDEQTKNISIQSFAPEVSVSNSEGKSENRKALATGSFSTMDTMESIGHEMVHMLRKPPKIPKSLEEVKALNRLIKQMAKQADAGLSNAKNAKQIEDALGSFAGTLLKMTGDYNVIESLVGMSNSTAEVIYKLTPGGVQKAMHMISQIIYENAMKPLADQLEALALETNVADTSMVEILKGNRETVKNKGKFKGKYGKYLQQGLDQVDQQGKVNAYFEQGAKESKAALEATPEKALAGPSHSQISKDHKNSVFFGVAFQLAVKADKMIKNKILEVWKGQGQAEINYGDDKPDGVKDMKDIRDREARENTAVGRHVTNHGYASETTEGKVRKGFGYAAHVHAHKPDLAKAMKNSADSIREVGQLMASLEASPAEMMKGLEKGKLFTEAEVKGRSTYLNEKLEQFFKASEQGLIVLDANVRPLKLSEANGRLKKLAEKTEKAKTLEDREKVYEHMTLMRSEFLKYLILQKKNPNFQGNRAAYAAALTGLNRAIAFNAPSFTSDQTDILEGKAHISGFAQSLQGDLKVDKDFKHRTAPSHKPGLASLIETSRRIIDHPQNNDWWKPTIRKYATDPKTTLILRDYIKARNIGFATFRNTHDH